MNIEIQINEPLPVILTFSMDKESDKIIDTYPELFQYNDQLDNFSDIDLRNTDIVTPYIKKSNMLFLIISVSSEETSIFQAIEFYELARRVGVFTFIIAHTDSTLDSDKQQTLAIRNMSELRQHVDSLLIISSRSVSHSVEFAELFKREKVIAPIRTLTEIVVSDSLFDLKAFQDSLYPGILYYSEETAHRDSPLGTAKNAVNKLMIQNEQALSFAKGILIIVMTSTKMTTEELDIISDYFNQLFAQSVDVMFLTPVVPLIKDQIRVSIICSGL